MTELYASPIFWAWSLFLSISWLAYPLFAPLKPFNFTLRLWWIVVLNGFILTAVHCFLLFKDTKDALLSYDFFFFIALPILFLVILFAAGISTGDLERCDDQRDRS